MGKRLKEEPTPQDNVSKIYSYLKQNNVVVPDNEDAFRASLSDKQNADKVHSYLKNNSVKVVESTDDFYQSINPVKKKDQEDLSVSSSGSEGLGEPSGKNTQSIQLSDEQKKVFAKAVIHKTPQQEQFEESEKRATKRFATKENPELFHIPLIEDLGKTVSSGILDQLPKEYYDQRLRMSKGDFTDIYDKRSDLNAFSEDSFTKQLPKGTSIDDFTEWNLKQGNDISNKSINERAKIFLTQKLGAKGFDELKSKFNVSNVKERVQHEKDIDIQNVNAGRNLNGVVQDLRDIHGATDFLNFAGNMIGQAIYRAPTSIVAGPMGSIISESSAVYDRQLDMIAEDKGISREEVIKQGLDKPAEGQALAVLAGTLDAASEFNLVGMFKKAAGKQLTEGMVKKFAKGFVRGAAPEAVTEVAQGELEEKGASQGAGVEYHPDGWRMATSAVGGIIGGGVIGSVSKINTETKLNYPKGDLGLTPEQKAQATPDLVKAQTEKLTSADTLGIEKAADVIDAKVQQADEATVAMEKPVTGTPSDSKILTDTLPTTSKLEDNAVQKSTSKTVLPGEQEGTGGQGSERGGVEPSQQGESATGESVGQEQPVQTDNQGQAQEIQNEGEKQQSVTEDSGIDVVDKKRALENASKIDKGSGSHIKDMSLQELKELANDMQVNEKEYQDKFNDAQGIYNLTTERIDELAEGQTKEGEKQQNVNQDENTQQQSQEKIQQGKREDGTTNVGNEEETGGTDGENIKEEVKLSPQDVHSAAESSSIDYEGKDFIEKSKELTGKEHLDDMNQAELKKMLDFITAKNQVNDKLNALVESGDIKRDGKKITIVTEKGGKESKAAYEDFKLQQEYIKNQREVKERKFGKQILSDKKLDKPVKSGLPENARTYLVESMSITDNDAKAIIDKGLEAAHAEYMDRSNGMTNRVRATLGQNLIRKYNNLKDYDNAIKVADDLSQYFTDLGQAVNSAKIFQMLDPEGVLRYASREINKSKSDYSKKTSKQREQVKTAIDAINKDAVEKILSDPKVKNKIADATKKGTIKKAIDFLETLKIDTKGKALDATYGLTAAAWNTLITTVQKGLQAGLTITQAINKAVGKTKGEKDFDEKGARDFLDDKLKDYRVTLDPERAIKEELKNQNDKIDNIIKEHYTVVEEKKSSLVKKLIKDANINEEQAENISKELSSAFDKLTKSAKEKALKKYLPKPSSPKKKINRQSLVDQIISDSNMGALTDEQYRDAINDKLGVDSMTEEQAKKLTELADKVQKSKEGFDKTNATEKLMNYMADMKGISKIDVAMSIWYANILSGISTQVLNISANFAETVGEAYTSAIQNPKETGWIMKGLFNGWGRGLLESLDTVQHGHQPTKFEAKISAASVLERKTFKGGKWNPYNYLKYVTRIMNAADIFFYHGINEMRARELAVALAKKESISKQPTKEIIKKATNILYKGENPYQESLDQAKNEGFTGKDLKRRTYEILEQNRPEFLIKDSNDEAARGTFNYDPEGTLGAMTAGINQLINKVDVAGFKPLKFVIPFTRIIANVTNRYLDWTPVGLLRAAKGGIGFSSLGENLHREYSEQERAEVLIRAITGIAAMVALYGLTDDDDGIFEITANGTSDIQKNFELQETGWRPYSIKINNTWYEYKNTPLAIPFATIGFVRDAEKYQGQKGLESKTSIIMFGTLKYVMDLSFLQSLSSFMDTFSKENRGGAENFFKKSIKSVESTAKSFVVPNAFTQVSRAMQEVMELPIKRADHLGDQIIRDMPILRDHLGNIYDALGDPVVPNQIERFIPLKPSKKDDENDKIWDLIIENQAWIGKPRRATQKLNGDTLTDAEYEKYSLLAGRLTKKALKMDYRYLSKLKDKETAKDEIDKIKSQARRDAREILFGF